MNISRGWALLVTAALCVSLCGMLSAAQEVAFSREHIKKIAGNGPRIEPTRSVSIAGELYDGYLTMACCGDEWVTLDIRGWDCFRAKLGIDDNTKGKTTTVTTEVDGQTEWTKQIRSGEKALPVEVSLTGHKTLTIRVSDEDGVKFAEPRLVKGVPPATSSASSGSSDTQPTGTAKYKCAICSRMFDLVGDRDAHTRAEHGGPVTTVSPASSAPFVVDPNDLERLATALRKRIDSKPDVKTRVDRGKAALMTFTLVDIPSHSVATNVAEDLYTSMINTDFRLVERGQLDKMIKELKIQDSALIDPATAEKLGKVSGCDMIILGSISDRGNVVVVNARIMETSTGTSIAAERIEMKKNPINR